MFPRISLIPLLLISTSSFAEDQTAESITVYASRSEENPKNIPASVQIIDRAAIEAQDRPGENLGTLLGKIVPGLGMPTESVSNFGQNLRGREVLILIDGIPQAENRSVSRQLDTISVHGIERIEVISGANAIYGAGAPGGIINVITKNYAAKPVELNAEVGTSFATKPLAASSQAYSLRTGASGTLGGFSYLGSIGADVRRNVFDADGNQIAPEPAQTSRGDTKTYDLLFKIAQRLSDSQSIELTVDAFQEAQDTEYAVQLDPYRAEEGLELDEQPQSKRLQTVLRFTDKELLGQKFQTQIYFRQRDYTFFPFALTQPVPLVNQSRSQSELYGLKSSFVKTFSPKSNIVYGIDYELEKGNQKAHSYNQLRYELSGGKVYTDKSEDYDYGPAIETQKAAFFTQLQLGLTDSLQSRLGIRYEKIDQKVHDFTPPLETAIGANWPIVYAGISQMEAAGRVPAGTTASLPTSYRSTNFEGGERSYDATAYNLGFVFDLTSQQQLYFNFSQGYELADTARLLRDAVAADSLIPVIGPVFRLSINASTVSNLELDAITTSNYEGGWRGNFGPFSSSLAIYYNESDKTYQFNRDFTVDLLDSKKRVYGAEALFDWRMTENTELNLSHSRNKGEYRNPTGGGWTALSAIDLSPPKTTAMLNHRFTEALAGGLLVQDIAPYNKGPDGDIQGYTTLDANALYAWSEQSHLRLAVQNVLNKDYKTVFHQWAEATYGAASGAPASGRRISLIYGLTF